EDMVVTLTHYGYVKRISLETYRAQKRGGRGITAMATREEDFAEQVFVTCTHNELLFFTNKGKVYTKKCYQIPEAGRTAKGTAIVNMLNLDPDEKVSAVFPIETELEKNSNLVIVTKGGVIKKTPFSEYANIRQNGLRAVNLREDDELISVMETDGTKSIIIGTRDGMAIIFSEEDVRPMGRVSTGVRGIRLREGDEVVDACIAQKEKQVLVITENGYGKRTNVEEYRLQTRGGIGLKSMNITDKTGKMCGLKIVDGTEDIMLINDAGIVIRMSVEGISLIGRSTQGVRVMRVDDDTKVVCVAKIMESEEEVEDEAGAEEAVTEDKQGE
ncbi:MAG: DNA gyrase C-terminal beta-propeller domain-containing protein, partial [Christensenella sp.]